VIALPGRVGAVHTSQPLAYQLSRPDDLNNVAWPRCFVTVVHLVDGNRVLLNANTLVSLRHFRDRASKAADDGAISRDTALLRSWVALLVEKDVPKLTWPLQAMDPTS
jgi:hypothetical protein